MLGTFQILCSRHFEVCNELLLSIVTIPYCRALDLISPKEMIFKKQTKTKTKTKKTLSLQELINKD